MEDNLINKEDEINEYKELSSIPITRNAMAAKYMKFSNKYRSKRKNQNSVKRNKIINREKKLKSVGWSLLMFK